MTLFWTIEPLANESIANIAYHQVEVLEDGRRGCEVEVIHLCNGQAEIDKLIVTTVETGQDWIIVIDPSLDIILHIEVYRT